MIGTRPRLGMALQNSVMPGDQPDWQTPNPFDPSRGPMSGGNPGAEVPKRDGGFLGEGGFGRIIAGAIGDALLQNADMQPVFAPMQRQKQQAAQDEVQWSRRREAENQDWTNREAWKLANKPKEPLIREDNAGNVIQIDPVTGQSKPLYIDRALKRVFVPDGMGGGQFVETPNPYLGSPEPTIPTAPKTAPRGQLKPYVGGGAGNSTGGFRP